MLCDIADAYRRAGINSSVVSEDDVGQMIVDASGEVEERYGRSFGGTTSTTEWKDFDRPPGETFSPGERNIIFLDKRPITAITSIKVYDTASILVETLTASDYWLYGDEGYIVLRDRTVAEQRRRLEVVYVHGYVSVPRIIRKLVSQTAAIMILVAQMGGTYDDVTSYSLPTGVSIGVGEPYMNMFKTLEMLKADVQQTIDTIGRLKTNSVVI